MKSTKSVRRIVEKWFCPLCSSSYAADVRLCERCRCTTCGRPVPRDAHACERDQK